MLVLVFRAVRCGFCQITLVTCYVCRLTEFDEKLLDSQRRDSATKELLARHESEIEERHATIRRLESELGRVTAELDRVKNELGQVSEERRRLADELAGARTSVTELEDRPAEAESELTRIRVELGQVLEERSRLTSDLDRARCQVVESEGRTHGAVQELNRVRSELTMVTGQLTDLDIRTSESMIQQRQLSEAKQRSDDLCQVLTNDLQNLKIKLAEVEGHLATARRSNEELQNQLSALVINVKS